MFNLIIFVTVRMDKQNTQNIFSIESGPFISKEAACAAGEQFMTKLSTPYVYATYSILPITRYDIKITPLTPTTV